jgi:hypothetical protein
MAVVWNVVSMVRDLPDGDTPPEGLVTTLHWTAQLGQANSYGSVGLGEPDPDNYTPYDQITQEQAVQWVKDALGTETVTSIESGLAAQEEEILNPTTADGVPW